jgi:hypothetical protein
VEDDEELATDPTRGDKTPTALFLAANFLLLAPLLAFTVMLAAVVVGTPDGDGFVVGAGAIEYAYELELITAAAVFASDVRVAAAELVVSWLW